MMIFKKYIMVISLKIIKFSNMISYNFSSGTGGRRFTFVIRRVQESLARPKSNKAVHG